MTGVRFSNRPRTPRDQAWPKMRGRTLERGQRAVVRAGAEARVEALSARLWTYHDRSFLPHGTVKDGRAERQPVWLTVADDEAPNDAPNDAPHEAPHNAQVHVLTAGAAAARTADVHTCAVPFGRGAAAAVAPGRAPADRGATTQSPIHPQHYH